MITLRLLVRVAAAALVLVACGGRTSDQVDAEALVDAVRLPDAALCMGAAPLRSSFTRQGRAPLLVPGQTHVDGTSYLLADPSLLYDESDSLWKVWYAGARGQCFSCTYTTVIEHAKSTDGLTWNVEATPAMVEAPGSWDAIRVETPDIAVDFHASAQRRYVMAYSGADQILGLGFPNYSIGIAFSADGDTFTRLPANESSYGAAGHALVVTDAFPALPAVNGGVVADPDLLVRDGVYHLWFSSFGCADGDTCADIRAFGISHATSTDGVSWTASPENPVLPGGQQPTVLWDAVTCHYEMWFKRDEAADLANVPSTFNPASGFWRATSPDGIIWTVDNTRDFLWDIAEPGEELGLLTGADIVRAQGSTRLYYVGMGTTRIPSGGFLIPVQSWYDSSGAVPGTFGLGFATR